MTAFARLHDEQYCARLVTIRRGVESILASNLLRSFTDHSVKHSDHVCELVDGLTAPMTHRPLSDVEAFILYASAYLHDVGMQHERCDETQVVQRALAEPPFRGRRWEDLEEPSRWELIRRHHNVISAEMILRSVDAPAPTLLGVQLDHRDHPAYIAALCEAHCLPTHSERYRELTADGPEIRMGLLSALLRLADILDESQRRTQRHRERTVRLGIESQMHWWRHHYVEKVTLDPIARRVTVWFGYPPGRADVYRTIIPRLQLPMIEAELLAHRAVLLGNGFGWHLESREVANAHSVAPELPEPVLARMLEELHREQQSQAHADRVAAIQELEGAQRWAMQRLDKVRASTAAPADSLQEVVDLAKDLLGVGGTHNGAMILYDEYTRLRANLDPGVSARFAAPLASMLLEAGLERIACQVLAEARPAVTHWTPGDPHRVGFLRVWCRSLLAVGAIEQGAEAFEELRAEDVDRGVVGLLEVELEEALLLQGEPPHVPKGSSPAGIHAGGSG